MDIYPKKGSRDSSYKHLSERSVPSQNILLCDLLGGF